MSSTSSLDQEYLTIKALYDTLEKEWKKKNPNLDECGKLLNQIKVALTKSRREFLPTLSAGQVADQRDFLLARGTLEIGAQWAVKMKEPVLFDRYMAQLKCYYLDYRTSGVQESAYKHQLLGLNLLRLLSANRLSDFHTELELLSPEDMQKNIYIKHPVQIEQYLMEGSYNKVFTTRDNIPAANYRFFMDNLLDTTRDEIASCIEKAYERISFKESQRMMFFESPQQMTAYAEGRKWKLGSDNVFHFSYEKKADDVIPSLTLAQQAIDYARELEMIV